MLLIVTALLLLLGVCAQEKQTFDDEVSRLIRLIFHLFYTHEEIFLRELISNSADALDKVRFLSITDKELKVDPSQLHIRIGIDANKGMVYVSDNGIGMTREELQKNLGTITKSGTDKLTKKLQQYYDKKIIRQFRVGFYSSYLVAENVTVISRKVGTEESNAWESSGDGFVVRDLNEGEKALEEQGTIVYLQIKDKYFLDSDVLKELVKKYSEFIQFPIEMEVVKKEEVGVEDHEAMRKEAEEKVKKRIEEGETGKTEEEMIEEELKNVEVKHIFVSKNITSWEAINTSKPICANNNVFKEYKEFYKALTKDEKELLAKIHFNPEKDSLFKALLFTSSEANSPFAPKDPVKMKQMLRLYVKRMFVSNYFDSTLPEYLNFIINRMNSNVHPFEVLKRITPNKVNFSKTKREVVRKVLQLIQDLSETNSTVFNQFMKEYSIQMKIGAITDVPNRGRIANLLRYRTSKSGNEMSSFNEYIERMKENQTEIYYICGDSLEEVKNSPVAQSAVGEGFEVIYMTDPFDELTSISIGTYEGKTLVDLGKDGFRVEKEQKEYDELKEFIKEIIGEVNKVEVSNKLGNITGAVILRQNGLTANMDFNLEDITRILVINGEHEIIRKSNLLLKENKKEEAEVYVKGMYNTALIQSGYSVNKIDGLEWGVQKIIENELNKFEENGIKYITEGIVCVDDGLDLKADL